MQCVICKNEVSEGISVLNETICVACEESITHSHVEDKQYQELVDRIKELWFRQLRLEKEYVL
ncbi:MAG: inhibitor of sigma-G Gin [Firmicutes bacterium]|jgi:hypothetical protein|nr:inhibitor of sigma-G Gin [Bacillota bacterium]